jgi:isopentenyl-diphosphate delta-isomerase
MDKKLRFPLLISSMTGGDHTQLKLINQHLAEAAAHTGIAMATGSQRVMFSHPDAKDSFALRKFAPDTLLWGNLGAVQLNYGFSIEHCRQAVEILQADALCLHLNPLQEAVQPEGNTRFEGLADAIGNMASALPVPVIIKEVGAGLCRKDAEVLIKKGIHYLDVAGAGGTSWSRIEHHRDHGHRRNELGITFQDWGNPTPWMLSELAGMKYDLTLIASGGIRSGIDMAKAMILGASLCGIARPFLEPAMESTEAVIAVIERLYDEFVTAMFLLGVSRIEQMIGHHELLA